ncbi:MAG: hypothetical protein HKN20_01810 [Gemmatimonadetes bacterium]|nr:hypothetical protein [Gemmatimonadota bacterium]
MPHDFTNELTVFVITVGAPSFDECRRRIAAQDCRFRTVVVDRVAPMSRALQRMIDQCETPFFVQVDEDMLLEQFAVRSLYERMIASPSETAILTCHLFDVHAERLIYGIKIYRHAIVKEYPYRNVEACEFDQIRRFRKDGFLDARIPIEDPRRRSSHTLGVHDAFWTPRAIYERYATLERKRRRHTPERPTTMAEWVKDHAAVFLDRFLESGSKLDFYALMGVIAGSVAPLDARGNEKDYREYARLPGFEHANRFLDEAAKRAGGSSDS